MKIGDLVRCTFKDYGIGIITIQWASGEVYGINGYALEVIA